MKELKKKPWEIGKLEVTHNGRYLKTGDTPFFWLGDTAWLLFQKLTLEETYVYLKNRIEKGFNVIQVDFIHSIPQENTYGQMALVDNDFTMPDLNSGYWEHIDKVITMAEELGLFMAILPIWGSSVVKGGHMDMTGMEEYTRFLVERYKNRPNIIWVVGGDIRADENLQLFDKMGSMIKDMDKNHLVTYHPFGRTSSTQWFKDANWIDFHMFQSGHRRYDQTTLGAWDDNAVKEGFFGEDNWRYVLRDHDNLVVKPTVDAEPSYELIPQGLHDSTQPYWQAHDVRRYAYWSVFAGALGHTYGDNSVMQVYKDRTKKVAYGAKDLWYEAIHHEGAGHMKHLRELMESVDFANGRVADELLLSGQKDKYERVSVFAGEDYIFCYTYLGEEFEIDISGLTSERVEAYWYDTISGVYSFIADVTGQTKLKVKPTKRVTQCNDWVLVVR